VNAFEYMSEFIAGQSMMGVDGGSARIRESWASVCKWEWEPTYSDILTQPRGDLGHHVGRTRRDDDEIGPFP
jgi:hypothetical protein